MGATLTIACHMKNSYGEPAFSSSNLEPAPNYFLAVVSAAGFAVVSAAGFTVVSTAGFAVVSTGAVVVLSVFGASVDSPLLQAVKAAAITRAKSTFFIF